ncbi:MAG: Gfo/Idh/MocA family oxidoreductase [Magnetococcales bacterium]|nr:Gfo/Idh/MocA family oxidoreductase [Magnetococcales bacterium]
MKPGKNIRVAVIGVGQMGRNHVRVYSQLRGVELVAVVDTDPVNLQETVSRVGCPGHAALEPILGRVDAVSVVTPPGTHARIGTFLMDHGIHCLIEKPLAISEEQGRQLIDAAARNNVVLLVGHIERFNPAVQALYGLLAQGSRIHAMDVRRMSSASARITDVDVIADLMTHDLDIVMNLMNQPVTRVVAGCVRTPDSGGGDYVSALLGFEGGAMAAVTASRMTKNRVRELTVTSDLGWLMVNFITQELFIHRQGPGLGGAGPSGPRYSWDHSVERVSVRPAESLAVELAHFIDAVRGGVPPLVTGQQALDVLKVARKIRLGADGVGGDAE